MSSAHKCSDSATGFDYTGSFQFSVNPSDCIGVHSQIDSHLPDGRQLVADAQSADANRELNCSRELDVKRHRIAWINEENLAHAQLVHLYYDISTTKVSTLVNGDW